MQQVGRGAWHGHGLIRSLTYAREGMKRDSQGLRHGSRIVVARFRHGTANRRGRGDKLSEPAVHLQTEGAIFGTEVRAAPETPEAPTTRDAGAGDDAVTDPDVRDLRTHVDDATDELVPQHDAGTAENRPVIPLCGVCAADRSTENLEDDLVRAGSARIRNVLDPYVPRSVEDGRPHPVSTRSGL